MLERRIEAGRHARDILALHRHRETADAAAGRLDQVLGGLGFSDGDLADRLSLAIEAVESASAAANRRRTGSRAELAASIESMVARVTKTYRPSWDGEPNPTSPPVDPALLQARRGGGRAGGGQQGSRPGRRRAASRVGRRAGRSLDVQLAELGSGPAPREQRLRDRVLRTTPLGDVDQTLPVVVGGALDDLDPADQLAVLDLLANLSRDTQVIVLSADPVVAGWACGHAGSEAVTLLEADVAVTV